MLSSYVPFLGGHEYIHLMIIFGQIMYSVRWLVRSWDKIFCLTFMIFAKLVGIKVILVFESI